MAHYEGETLKERISKGPLELGDAIDIATQVGEGLAEAHKAGIVHRDIKPANLLVTKTGVVKILDFGLAKLAGIEGVTQTGTTVGTVAYMSPEQARGQKVDHRTDIWSLGVVLYEMLAGKPPFQGENLLAILHAILDTESLSLALAGIEIPAPLERIVGRMLSRTPEARYQAVADLLVPLRQVTGAPGTGSATRRGEDASSGPPTLHQEVRFCTTEDGVTIAYACVGRGQPLVRTLGWFTNLEMEWAWPAAAAFGNGWLSVISSCATTDAGSDSLTATSRCSRSTPGCETLRRWWTPPV